MAAAYGYLALTAARASLSLFLSVVVCMLGIIFAEALVRIIVRHHKWHAWFIKKYVAVPGNLQQVYPGEIERLPAKIADMDSGYIAKIIRTVGWLLDAGWVVAAVVLLMAK
jgi:hypothetical protein